MKMRARAPRFRRPLIVRPSSALRNASAWRRIVAEVTRLAPGGALMSARAGWVGACVGGAAFGALILGAPSSQRTPAEGSASVSCESQLSYAPKVNLEEADVALISSAAKTINLAAYSLTDRPVIAAIDLARRRGVAVRLVLDRTQAHAYDELAELSDSIRLKRAGPIMHLKSYSLDGRTLRSGSANLSSGGLRLQDNDLMVSCEPRFVAAFDERFEEMWSAAQPLAASPADISSGQAMILGAVGWR
jgi:phosphatidylserine/phosphatidylglycerophosphate/cardiolipin synthase-like enzyme